ncbi:hypothetical protein ABC382_00195 [Lysinibacillus sp. 1P01SD]|uniref:hypothetical protein n=1 Tax=Lysinibacillus sp. 1P01SD TaxID=3132285 RepID=UPI0039A3B92D
MDKFLNRRKLKSPKNVVASISSKRSKATGTNKERLSFITVRVENREFLFFSNINEHYKIISYPLYAVELVNKVDTSQLLYNLKQDSKMYFEVNGQYFPTSILNKLL